MAMQRNIGGARLDDGGEPPEHERMEARIKKLEEEVATIKIDVAAIKSNYATKADIAELKTMIAESKSSIIMWVVSAFFLTQLLPTLIKYIEKFF